MLGLFSSLAKFNKGGSSTRNDVGSGIDNAKKKTIGVKSFFKKSSGNDDGGGGSSSIILRPSSILSTKTIKTSSFLGKEAADAKPETEQDQKKDFEDILNELSLIKGSLTKINEAINSNLEARKNQLSSDQVARKKKRFRSKEDELEKKKKSVIPGVPAIAKPGMSFFDMILNYITNVFLGSLAVFALSKLPQIIAAFNTISKNLSNVFNQVKAAVISITTNFPKQVKSLVKLFQKIVSSKPAKAIGQLLGKAGKVVANIFAKAGKAIFNIIKGPVKNILGKTVSGGLGAAAKGVGSITKKGFGKAIPRAAAAIGGKNAAAIARRLGILTDKGAKHFARIGNIFKRIPFVGALIGIGIDLALGVPPDAAVAGAIGASLGAAIGGAIGTGIIPIPGVGSFLGGVVGAGIGDWAGKEIYKNLKGNVTGILPQPDNTKVQKQAEGGETTRATGVEKRQLRKVIVDRPIRRPGNAQPISKSTEDNAKKYFFRGDKSLGRFKRISKSYSDMRFVGNLLKLGIDMGMGEKPNQNNINVAADSLAYSVAMAVKREELELPGVNKNTSGTIANSLSSWARKEIYREIIRKRGDLALKEDEKEEIIPGMPGDFPAGSVPGGQLTMNQLVGLAKGAGFSDSEAVTMAAIAMAESGGNSNARNFKPPDKSYGLWQINMIGPLGPARLKEFGLTSEDQLFDPVTNAKAAYAIRKSQGLGAWTVYKTGKYKNFLQQAEAAKSAPSLRVSPIASAPSLGNMSGNLSAAQQLAASMGLQVTSYIRPGDPGYHGKGRAMDFQTIGAGGNSGTPSQMQFAQTMATQYGANLAELIYTPLGYGIKDKKVVPLSTWGAKTNAEHYNHVHVAFARGGRVKKETLARIGEKGEEMIFDHDTTKGLDSLAPRLLDKLNIAKTKSQLASILQEYSDNESDSVIFLPLPQKQSPEVSSGESGGMQIIPIETGVNNRITYDTVFQSALYKV